MEGMPALKKARLEFPSEHKQLSNSNEINESANCLIIPTSSLRDCTDLFGLLILIISFFIVDDIAQLLLVKNFVVVQGPSGSGKTHSAKIISEKLRLNLNILQISHQVDVKLLYGSYTCTEVPGEFVWKPSKFAQCLQQECLILLENIDHGGPDLASAILQFVNNGCIELPNGMKIKMNKNCRILGSIEENAQQIFSIPLILQEYPYKVKLSAPSFNQLNNNIKQKYPKLENIREKIISLFIEVSDLIKTKKISIDRLLNTRDLFVALSRLCSSPINILNDPRALFLELFDVWAVHLTSISLKLDVANCISEALSLSKEEQNFLLNIRHPKVVVNNENVEIGRINLERRLLTDRNSQSSNFVLTRDATCLLERLAISIIQTLPEPILLTGETGVGKTSSIQYLSHLLRVPLRVVNLSQESESTDLLGGYKPTSPLNILRPLADEYFRLFKISFDLEKNSKFLNNVNKCFNSQRFGDFLQLILKSSTRICRKLPDARNEWMQLAKKTSRMIKYFADKNDGESWRRRMFFAYVKGVVTEAIEQGQWLLVDEINLASTECLDVIVELLELSTDVHKNFRLFACMNHATDIGKRLLPSGIRAKFTEIFVSEIVDVDQLHILIRGHLPSLPKNLIDGTLNFYKEIIASFPLKFSLRNLSRALSMVSDNYYNNGQLTSVLSACRLSFSSQLGVNQRIMMSNILAKSFGLSSLQFPAPKTDQIDDSKFILIEGFPIPRGSEPVNNEGVYVFTPSVRENIKLLANVVSTRKYPILLEGETSAGKTSMVIQLAKMSGNCVYRINNHEHSDIQEYIGTYAPDMDGRLVFTEGLLLKALKFGHWIILDELNLAPSAVLEALNRLLDDNRELFVPELNYTIKAHPNFQLFATQNPFGAYSGRKRLSRAFLNRFMVIQCDIIPLSELPQIVQHRCGIAPKQAKLAVDVLYELRNRRAISKIFSSSDGLMTLRDLFRWANRLASQKQVDDWRQSMADHGYFVLGTRCRTPHDEREVINVLEQKLQRKINVDLLFGQNSPFMPNIVIPQQIVLTAQLRRTLILCSEAWKCDEPVLLVGDTGCGKTSAVHLFGDLLSINCHERTDASDLLGSVRPFHDSKIGPTFQWKDGIVVQAMRRGQRVLIDEISLASDSVLERLNSLLESERTILLTNPASSTSGDSNSIEQLVRAICGFQLVATMNPGNDYGKRELSKALRNRFTEIWCPNNYYREDGLEILRRRLQCDTSAKLTMELMDKVANVFIDFTEFFTNQLAEIIKNIILTFIDKNLMYDKIDILKFRFSPSLRDLVGLAELFMEMLNTIASDVNLNTLVKLLYHSIEATFLDALGVMPQRMSFNRNSIIEQCRAKFSTIVQKYGFICENVLPHFGCDDIIVNDYGLSIGPFFIKCSDENVEACKFPKGYSINSPSTCKNLLRIARALSSNKPIMLEGSPGSGKSSLVMALAAATGHKLIRLNLSEQTDVYDLFGTDVPVAQSNGKSATFAWRDGPVLKAIKEGSWILLDEMNLASQSVLEGLNSCFDFRKNIYISELDRTFDVDARRCRFFACQNPHSQGGDRRALPKSFVNRFTSIFIEEMTDDDFIFILTEYSKTVPNGNLYLSDELIAKIILINKLFKETNTFMKNSFEFNLRDLFRFLEAIVLFRGNVDFSFDLVYLSRLTSKEAKQKVCFLNLPLYIENLMNGISEITY
uniref:Midasin n=2 Tax=Meloidogyne TaxID=189290 RepID=A0A915P399_9BILA